MTKKSRDRRKRLRANAPDRKWFLKHARDLANGKTFGELGISLENHPPQLPTEENWQYDELTKEQVEKLISQSNIK